VYILFISVFGAENSVEIQTTLNGILLTSKLKTREFRTSVFFIGGAVTFTLCLWNWILRRIPDKNDRCVFTRGSRGEVMLFFETNKVLGVEPNRVFKILEGI